MSLLTHAKSPPSVQISWAPNTLHKERPPYSQVTITTLLSGDHLTNLTAPVLFQMSVKQLWEELKINDCFRNTYFLQSVFLSWLISKKTSLHQIMRWIWLILGYLKIVIALAFTWFKQNKPNAQVIYKNWKLFWATWITTTE